MRWLLRYADYVLRKISLRQDVNDSADIILSSQLAPQDYPCERLLSRVALTTTLGVDRLIHDRLPSFILALWLVQAPIEDVGVAKRL